jgi:hypothetical protein
MRQYPSDIAFTPAVKRFQAAKGACAAYAKVESWGWRTRVTPELSEFLGELDMFYLGTGNAEGQPYTQYRGDHHGFPPPLAPPSPSPSLRPRRRSRSAPNRSTRMGYGGRGTGSRAMGERG